MYSFEIYRRYELNDMLVLYFRKDDQLAFSIIPANREGDVIEHRADLNDTVACKNYVKTFDRKMPAVVFDSMAQLHIQGDVLPGDYGIGESMRNSGSTKAQKLVSHEDKGDMLVTIFSDERGIELIHTVRYKQGHPYILVNTELTNNSEKQVTVEMLESFDLGMLSPFHADTASDALVLHRYHAHWSAEGRPESRCVEEYDLDPSWTSSISRNLRFGQRSTLVVKDYFPTLGLEDKEAKVTWAAQLATISPWQMHVYRQSDFLNIAGGLPDREFADYRRTLEPGETLEGIPAVLTCVTGDMQDALNRLTQYPLDYAEAPSPAEADFPIIFNEFCSTWGKPSEENLLPLIEAMQDYPVEYFVLDAGWFRPGENGMDGIGDWNLSIDRYPNGFGNLIEKIRDSGFTPGIWFEFENCSRNSNFFHHHQDLFVTFEGTICDHGKDRFFLDFRKQDVWDYLDDKFIGFLKKYNIGYLKTDYNATLAAVESSNGSGASGLQDLLAATRRYYQHLKEELPELTLEICASGGHRLTPEWMCLGDMASFSDAHETLSIPIVGANVSMLIPFACNQVWVTLREGEDIDRTYTLLAGGFLGRFALSGDIAALSADQKSGLSKAMNLYRKSVPVLQNGESRLDQQLTSGSYNYPKGHQTFRRATDAGEVVVVHTFGNGPDQLIIPTEFSNITDTLHATGIKICSDGENIILENLRDFSGAVILLGNA